MSDMTSEREARILQAAVDTYGAMEQTDMMIDEMSELTKALLKYRRAGANGTLEKWDLYAVLEEMADVGIMLNQMCLIYGDPTEWEIKKLERLEARLGLIDGEPPFLGGSR